MKSFLVIFFIIAICGNNVFAASSNSDGFYVGVDPAKTNSKIGNANKAVSLDAKVAEDRYYGYKFSNQGFFVAPELFMQNGTNLTSGTNNSTADANSKQLGVTYDVKANLGYEFNRRFLGFVSYDLGSLAYGSSQRQFAIGANRANNSMVGIGSQINLSNDFGVKFIYSQQQFENSATGGAQIKSEVVKVGTVYSF